MLVVDCVSEILFPIKTVFWAFLTLSLPVRVINETSKLIVILSLDVIFHSIIFIKLRQFFILAP